MKLINCVMVAALVASLVSGCFTSGEVAVQPAPIAHVSVTVSNGQSLKEAVIAAATRRKWMPTEKPDGAIHCTLVQRQHRVEIDVVLEGDSSYSINCVSCNIPLRKYQQWIANFQREIAQQAILRR